MIELIIAFAIAFTNAQSNVAFEYVEFYDVRDSTNNFENLRITYKICALINDEKSSIEQCQKIAYDRAISIDA